MVMAVADRARQILVVATYSKDKVKREAASKILMNTELFDLFCQAVVSKNKNHDRKAETR